MENENDIGMLSVPFDCEDRAERVATILQENGVVVITDVFSPDESDQYMNGLVNGIQAISPQISTKSLAHVKKTWTDSNVMPQVRKGLHQMGYSFLGLPIRGSTRVYDIFRETYTILRGYPVNELITSLDAINVRPPIPPFNENNPDWAHVDQTESADIFKCVQGQVVLTNTTASFRCSPKSHLVHAELLQKYNALGQKGNWYRFQSHMYQEIRQIVEREGGQWQIPIVVPKGSMILWLSTTIHSARLAYPVQLRDFDPNDKWKHWRGVVYVCLRPKFEVNERHIRQLQYAYENNITTNHWGDKLFQKIPHFAKKHQPAPNISTYTKKPSLILDIPGLHPVLNDHQKRLLGYLEYDNIEDE